MVSYPRLVDRLEAAKALAVSTRTICNLVRKPHTNESLQVPFLALAKAAKCEPAWLLACLRGEDRAASISEAALAMGLNQSQMAGTAYQRNLVKPAAMLPKGWRYSAKALGIFSPTSSVPPVGHPGNPFCGED